MHTHTHLFSWILFSEDSNHALHGILHKANYLIDTKTVQFVVTKQFWEKTGDGHINLKAFSRIHTRYAQICYTIYEPMSYLLRHLLSWTLTLRWVRLLYGHLLCKNPGKTVCAARFSVRVRDSRTFRSNTYPIHPGMCLTYDHFRRPHIEAGIFPGAGFVFFFTWLPDFGGEGEIDVLHRGNS